MAKKSRKSASKRTFDWHLMGRGLLGLALFSLMGGGGFWIVMKLQDPTVLPLRVVRIDGQLNHMKRTDVEQALGSVVAGNFFTMDVEAVQRAALKLPWVERVSVRRVWPDTVRMWVRERTPLARWGEKRLVSTEGESFEPPFRDIPEGLPHLHGPDGMEKKVLDSYLDMQRRLAPLELEIVTLRLDARHAWWVTLRDGLELRLGNTDTEERLQRFVRVYPRLVQEQEGTLTAVDLRYTNGLAARHERGTT